MITLSAVEIDSYLRKIFTGVEIVSIQDKYFLFKQPDNNMKIIASNLYDKAYKKACAEGILPRADLEMLIDSRGIITDFDRAELSKLEAKLEAQKILLAKTTKVKANQDRLKKIISDLRRDISRIKYKKSSKLLMSAEVKAEEQRYEYLCRKCTYVEDGTRLYWADYEEFINDLDLEFKSEILNEFAGFLNGMSTEVVRYIARHNLWRIRYITSVKTSEALFGVPTSDYSDDMLNLVFWSNYYQNIYEMMPDDRPHDNVIEDDESLDAYMNSYYEEKDKELKARNYRKKMGRGKLSAFDSEEVIITRSNELYEDIKYDKPREAQRVKDRTLLKNRTKRRS